LNDTCIKQQRLEEALSLAFAFQRCAKGQRDQSRAKVERLPHFAGAIKAFPSGLWPIFERQRWLQKATSLSKNGCIKLPEGGAKGNATTQV